MATTVMMYFGFNKFYPLPLLDAFKIFGKVLVALILYCNDRSGEKYE
jgi:hypothetical protein